MEIGRIEIKKLLDVTIAVNQLCNEARYRFTNEGLKITEMDPANVSLINAEISASNFIELNEELSNNPQNIGLNTTNLLKLLKSNKKGDVNISITEDNFKLKLLFSNGLNAVIPLIDLTDLKDCIIPNLSAKTIVTTDSKIFRDSINSLSSISESVTFKAENNKFMLCAESDLNKAEMPVNALNDFESSICKYSMEYLKKFFKVLLNSNVQLKFNTDYPIQVIQEEEGIKLYSILAPRIENN